MPKKSHETELEQPVKKVRSIAQRTQSGATKELAVVARLDAALEERAKKHGTPKGTSRPGECYDL